MLWHIDRLYRNTLLLIWWKYPQQSTSAAYSSSSLWQRFCLMSTSSSNQDGPTQPEHFCEQVCMQSSNTLLQIVCMSASTCLTAHKCQRLICNSDRLWILHSRTKPCLFLAPGLGPDRRVCYHVFSWGASSVQRLYSYTMWQKACNIGPIVQSMLTQTFPWDSTWVEADFVGQD